MRHNRQRSKTFVLSRASTDDDMTFDDRYGKRKTIRRKLKLAPKLEKQKAVAAKSADETMHFKKLHEDYAMIKYPRNSKWAIPSEKIFRLDKDNLQVMWRKNFASCLKLHSSLCLDSILEVRLGQYSIGFERFPYDEVNNQSFSLMYESVKGKYIRLESLDLICDHPIHFKEWINGLDSLKVGPVTSMFPLRYENTDPLLVWLKRFWTLLQDNHEINEKGALYFAHAINPNVDKRRLKLFLDIAHTHQHEATLKHGKALKWDGFVLLYNVMCGENGRLYNLFRVYAVKYKRLGMTLNEFRDFLIQECNWTAENCSRENLKELIGFHNYHHSSFNKFTSNNKPSNWKISVHLLSFAGFLSFIRSKHNPSTNPLHNTVYQDMTQPLSHYFINTSHNTYLEGDQIKGKSSLDAYVRSLLMGSRCIEIDCWDNTVGREPLIYHGYTLTTKLPFTDVIRTIKDYAFRMSHYPLVISIENHCSSAQQKRMAQIFREELTDELGRSVLATENLVEGKDVNKRRLPSPIELQGQILLKGSYKQQTPKIMHKFTPSKTLMFFKMSSSESDSTLPKLTHYTSLPSNNTSNDNLIEETPNEATPNEATPNEATPNNLPPNEDILVFKSRKSSRREAKTFRRHVIEKKGDVEVLEDDQELTYIDTSDDLKDLIIYCKSTSIKPWSWREQKLTSVCQMFSFSEISAADKLKKTPREMLSCSERQLVRVYPRGSRIESSNYNPIQFWNHGIQMVALNYQTPDVFMHLNQGRFRQNGGCGYILKPEIMRKANPGFRDQHPFNINMIEPHPLVPVCNFEIELLSGQNLCVFGKRSNNVHVSISMHGIPADCREMTKADTTELLWPQWAEGQHCLKHQVLMPELCLIYFRVDLEGSLGAVQLLGQNCIPLPSLLPGIKFIQLRKAGGELIPESGLFVQLKIDYKTIKPEPVPDVLVTSDNEGWVNIENIENDKTRKPMLQRQSSIDTASNISENTRLSMQVIPSPSTGTISEPVVPESRISHNNSPVEDIELKLEYYDTDIQLISSPCVLEVTAEVNEDFL
jgi:hypothetical protein